MSNAALAKMSDYIFVQFQLDEEILNFLVFYFMNG